MRYWPTLRRLAAVAFALLAFGLSFAGSRLGDGTLFGAGLAAAAIALTFSQLPDGRGGAP